MRACIGYLRVPAAGDGETLFALLNFSSDAPRIVLRDLGQPLGPVRPLLSTAGQDAHPNRDGRLRLRPHEGLILSLGRNARARRSGLA
jgi:hypothetical protein